MKRFSKQSIFEKMSSFERRSSGNNESSGDQVRNHSDKPSFFDRAEAFFNKVAKLAKPIKKIAGAVVSVFTAFKAIRGLSNKEKTSTRGYAV